ncbi:MAG TPA: hypothetical protein VGI40_10745 [Pirellulaceae bacterium]|jgi:hypothetical protein
MSHGTNSNRRWFQWSLRSFLIAIVVIATGLAWWSAKRRREARINNAVRLIASSPSYLGSDQDFDQIGIVRAVNALHALGKADALDAMRRYTKQYPAVLNSSDYQIWLETSYRYQSLRTIIPLLFDRRDPEDRYPIHGDNIGAFQLPSVEFDWRVDDWRWFAGRFVVESDIPFQRSAVRGYDDSSDLTYVINWAEQYGRLRESPLRPADNPFDAADRVVAIHKDWVDKESIRYQVFLAIAHLVPESEGKEFDLREWDRGGHPLALSDDANWERLKALRSELGIRWNAQKQAYEATKGPRPAPESPPEPATGPREI